MEGHTSSNMEVPPNVVCLPTIGKTNMEPMDIGDDMMSVRKDSEYNIEKSNIQSSPLNLTMAKKY